MHVHTIVWATFTLLAVRALYRQVNGPGWGAVLALAMYTFDDARGAPVAWIANRNAFVACSISAWALYLYIRGRNGEQRATLATPLVFAISLLGGEGAMAITPYALAHVLFLQQGPLSKRLASLWPFASVAVLWALVYRSLGYGISGSGVYFDPLREPGEFLRMLPERFAMLWFAQLGGPWSEGWNGYSVMFPGLEVIVAVLAVLALAGAAVLFTPILKRDAVARFWLFGGILSTLPACGAFPADRLLPWVSIGGMGLTARFLSAFIDSRPGPGFELSVSRVGAFLAALAHLVSGPLLFPLRATGISQVRAALDRADQSIPSDPGVKDKVVVLMNPPADPFASYIPVTRAVLGIPRAKTQRWLADGTTDVKVTRLDDRTLRVEPDGGFMILTSERLFHNARRNPYHPGDVVNLPELRVTIDEVTSDGRPRVVSARLDRPLEDPSYVLMSWQGGGYAPYTPPAIGPTETLPAADLVTVMYGPDSPVTKWLDRKR
jgi:hypothetical protein